MVEASAPTMHTPTLAQRLATGWRLLSGTLLAPQPCPACGSTDRTELLRRDRYFLPVSLSVCNSCGLVHLAQPLKPEAEGWFYQHCYPVLMGKGARQAAEMQRRHAQERAEALHDLLDGTQHLLDVGCGFGAFLSLASSVPLRSGVEPGGPQRAAAASLSAEVCFVPALIDLPADRRPPDLVTLFHVLEHVGDPVGFLRQLRDLADPKAQFVIEVPDFTGDWSPLGLSAIHVSHRCYFTPQSLQDVLGRAELVITAMDRTPTPIYPGNLRVVAERSDAGATAIALAAPVPALPAAQESLRRGLSNPWRTGQMRTAIRFLRVVLGV